MEGWIKLHRKIFQSETFRSLTAEQQAITYRILLEVNHKDCLWTDSRRGIQVNVKRGQRVVSRNKIANEWFSHDKSVTERKIRTLLVKLEKLNFLTIETTNRYTIITVVNYDFYQGSDQDTDQVKVQEMSKRSPSDVQVMSTNKNVKNVKNEKESNNDNGKPLYMNDFAKLYQKFENTFGYLSPMEQQALNDYLDEGFEYEVVHEAIKRTLRKADKPSFSYMKRILNQWSSKKLYKKMDVDLIDPFRDSISENQKEDDQENEWRGLSPIRSDEEIEKDLEWSMQQDDYFKNSGIKN